MGRNDEHMDKKIELVSRGFSSESPSVLDSDVPSTDPVYQSTKIPSRLRMRELRSSRMRTSSCAVVSLLSNAR